MPLPPNRPFHLALPVHDLEAARRFYGDLIGCRVGREEPGSWIDFDFGGHQLSLHLKPDDCLAAGSNAVDGDAVPVRHFGLVLPMPDWRALAQRLTDAGAEFIIAPKVRFEGQAGEQATLFLADPSGNALEFKAFGDDASLFTR